MIILAVFLAKLLSPIGGVLALVVGCANGSRWMIAAGAIAGTLGSELVLAATRYTYSFEPVFFLIGLIAFAVWAGVGNILIRRVFNKSESK